MKLTGHVMNGSEPILWANVIISDHSEKVITGSITKDDGSFAIIIKKGSYKLKVSFLGFTSLENSILLEKDTDLGKISLTSDSKNLKEIVVTARKPLIEQKTDRIIFHTENNISASGGNAINVLRLAPGLTIQNNTISILGKGSSHVMINGRLIELSAEDLITYLNSISADDIKSVEVITTPPAQYEAGGNGGLINIILKKGINDSWKNSATLAYNQNKYGFLTLRDNFLYNKNKVKLSISTGGNKGYSRKKQDLNTYYPGGLWELNYDGKQKEDNLSGRIALDYDLSKKTTIGGQYLQNYNNPSSKDYTSINIRNTSNTIDSVLINNGFRKLDSKSNTYNIHLISNLDTLNRKVSFDVDYFTYDSKSNNNFKADMFSPPKIFSGTNLSAQNVSNQKINNLSAKMDIEHPLKLINLSYGAKISFTNSQSDVEYYNTMTGNHIPDPNQSNEFKYIENNQAVYINGVKKFNDKLNFQVGLRLENTQTSGLSRTLNQTNHNNYLKLFPTVYIAYKQNEDHSFLFNYGKRIERPGFAVLNPFRSYINSTSYSEGNPFLQPSYSNNFDFTYSYKGSLRTNAFLNVTSNGFGVIFTSDPVSKTQIITRQNYYKEYYYGIGENYSSNILPWWQNQTSVYLLASKTQFTTQIGAIPQNGSQIYFAFNNTFSLSQSFKIQADYTYTSSFNKGLYKLGYTSGLNIGLKQTLLKKNISISLFANDVFNTAYLKNYTSIVNGIKQVYNENNSSRFFRLSLTYNFGNNKLNAKQRNFGNDEERKRAD